MKLIAHGHHLARKSKVRGNGCSHYGNAELVPFSLSWPATDGRSPPLEGG